MELSAVKIIYETCRVFSKRPITTIMLILIIVVLGGMSLWQLNVELMPKITFPNLQ